MLTKDLTVFMFDIPPRIINQVHSSLNMNEMQIQANAAEIGSRILFAYVRELVAEGSTANLTVYGRRGDTDPLMRLKVVKQNGEVCIDAESLQKSMGLNEVEWQEGLEVIASAQHLDPDEMFVHPLAETSEINGETMLNMYAVGMMFINCIRRIPLDDGDIGNPEQAEKFLTNLLFQAKPEADSQALIGKIKLHDKSSMMMVCTFLADFKPKA